MLMTHCEVDVGLTVGCGIKGSLHEMFLHRSARSLGIFVEEQHTLGQLSVVESLSLEHLGSHSLVVAFGQQGGDVLALVLQANIVELIIEGKLLDVVEILLLEVGCGFIILGVHEGKHVLEHAACSSRCRNELHHLLAGSLVLLPTLLKFSSRFLSRGNNSMLYAGGSLEAEEGESGLKLV